MEADTGNNSVSFVVLGNCLVCAAEINLCADKVKVNIFVQLILVGKKDNIIFVAAVLASLCKYDNAV